MYSQLKKMKGTGSEMAACEAMQNKLSRKQGFDFLYHQPKVLAQRNLQEKMTNNPQVKNVAQIQAMLSNYPLQEPIQRKIETKDKPDSPKFDIEYHSGNSTGNIIEGNTEILQRYVMRRTSKNGWVYYSSHDPSTTYQTPEEAQKADSKLEAALNDNEMEWEEGTRFPTLYSYTHTGTSNQMSDKPQGPHTAPHILIDKAFGKLQYQDEFLMVFYEQVPTPEDVRAIIVNEKGGKFGAQVQYLERFLYDYESLYESIESAIWSGQTGLTKIQLQLRMMLEQNPYATYAWKTNKSASRASLKFKNENRNSNFRDAIDSRGSSKFRDKEEYNNFIDKREMLVDEKYKLTQEEVEYDGQLDGEYVSQEELVRAVLCKDEVVGNTINLYPTGEWIISKIQIIYDNDMPVNAKVRLKRKGG